MELGCDCTSQYQRTIVHIDIDCFYAQVEMVENPELQTKPLGIKQKNIVVTSNYVARQHGVNKLMLVKEALKKCPELVLVPGEDLTKYREMSYRITELLKEFCPLVERLGFDENYIDISALVKARLEKDAMPVIHGHSLGEGQSCPCNCQARLQMGSQIANEMRQKIHERVGLTSCAGVAHNKLVAKLVSSSHKPNQQTTVFPEGIPHLLSTLSSIRSIPGIGDATSKKLAMSNIHSIKELQESSTAVLVPVVGPEMATQLLNWSWGCDNSKVIPSGPPLSLSLEDAFQKCCSVTECKLKLESLVQRLVKRILDDGRQPRTIRLTLRKHQSYNRESRQCSLPPGLMSQLLHEDAAKVSEKLLCILMELFQRMIDDSQPFHLRLLGIGVSNMTGGRTVHNGIRHFFDKASPSQQTGQNMKISNVSVMLADHEQVSCYSKTAKHANSSAYPQSDSEEEKHKVNEPIRKMPKLDMGCVHEDTTCSTPETAEIFTSYECLQIPNDIDRSVFKELSGELQKELLAEWKTVPTCSISSELIPPGINADVFSELPLEIQQELRREWKGFSKFSSPCNSAKQANHKNRKKTDGKSILHYFKKDFPQK